MALRQELDLYICLRPVRYYDGTPSPVKRPDLTDMVIFRENAEDIYAGIEWKADSAEAKKVIDFLRRLYEESTGRTDFEYTLIEDELQKMYREDRQVVNIYTLFAGIAIFISSLGLLSISLFDIRQRYREIGLRKVNGAQAKDIYPLLIKKYLSVMGVATLLSIPLSWIAITLYLQDFAHKAPLTFDLFAVAVAITTAISLLTIIRQISKAANINPASIMKNE